MSKIHVSLSLGYILFPEQAYEAVFDDYDGAPDAGFQPIGRGATEKEAIADLTEQAAEG